MNVLLEAAAVRHPAARRGAAAAVGPLSLGLDAGEQVAIIGPSGAGKTTLLLALACALRPTSGRVLLDGADPWALSAAALRQRRGQLFLAPQVPPLPPRQRVVTAVLAGRLPQMGLLTSLRNLLLPTDLATAHAALDHFDLADKLFDRVDRLSGGERQRVGLARALVARARLLLVDEPLSALDPARAGQAMQSLVDGARECGATLVCTMHDVPMALRHFPRVIGLREGAVQFDLPPQEVGPDRLQTLYHGHLEELQGPPPPELPVLEPARPAVLHCR
ncbi:MAG: phosphonate ABC transporter ATP-binding protein [Ramlibacter sp.]